MAFRYSRRKSSVFRSGGRLMTQELDLRPLFTAMDRDCNGFIDRDELRATMWDIGMHVSDRDLDLMMKVAGVIVKDYIFYEDFVKMMGGTIGRSQRKLMLRSAHGRKLSDMSLLVEGEMEDKTTQAMRVAFASFDHDGDGLISSSEANFTLTSLGIKLQPDDLNKVFKVIDKNGDGLISFEEFRDAMLEYEESADKKVFLPPPVSGDDDVIDENDKCGSIVHVIFDGGLVVDGNEVVLPVDDEADSEDDDDDDDVEYVGENQQRFMKEAFRIFDKDNDGYLSERDLRCTMWHLGLDLSRDDVRSMFIVLGINPGGRIPFDVFRNMWFGRTDKTLENICLRNALANKALHHRPSIFAASESTDWEVPQEFQHHIDQKKHYQDLLNFVFQEFSDELNEKFKDSIQEERPKHSLPVLSESQENLAEEDEKDEIVTKPPQPFLSSPICDQDQNIYDNVYDSKDKIEDKMIDTTLNIQSVIQPNQKVDCERYQSSNKEIVAQIHPPLQTIKEEVTPPTTIHPFVSTQKKPKPPNKPPPQKPFLNVTPAETTHSTYKEIPADLQLEMENLQNIRRQKFLDLSKMTDSIPNTKSISKPFAVAYQKSSYGSNVSGFSLSPVYDIPYPSPTKKPKTGFQFASTTYSKNYPSSSSPSTLSGPPSTSTSYFKSSNLPFFTTATTSDDYCSYSSYKNKQKMSNASTYKTPHTVETSSSSSKPFMSSILTTNKSYPYPIDWKSINYGDKSQNIDIDQYSAPDSYFSSVVPSYSTHLWSKAYHSNQSKDSNKFIYNQEKYLSGSIQSTTSQASKSILLKPKAHYVPGGKSELRGNHADEIGAKSSSTPHFTANKTVNFKLSTEDGIKILSCGTEEVYPDEDNSGTFSRSEVVRISKRDPCFTLQKPYVTSKPKPLFTMTYGHLNDRSSLSSDDSDLRSSSSVASSKRDQSDSSADNTLTLLTIKECFTSGDKLEKEKLVIGRIEKPSQHLRHDKIPQTTFPKQLSSTITDSLEKSDSRLLSKLTRTDIPFYQVPLSKAGPSKTLHFVSPNQTPSTPRSPNQLRIDMLSTNQMRADMLSTNQMRADMLSTTNQIGSSPSDQTKLSKMITHRSQPATISMINKPSAIKLNKLSHFEGVVPSLGDDKTNRKSIITLEKFSLKDESAIKPGTFVEHERTKTKTENRVTFRESLKLKSSTVEGDENLTLSQKVATASKTLAANRNEGRRSNVGKKVVLSRLDVSKGDNLIASGVAMDTYKLYREPSSSTGMRWNAVRRLMQHMCTDQHGNKHFFFTGSLFPRKFQSKDYAWKAFKVFDKNLDGFISWFELNTTFKDLGMKKTNFELCCIMDENDSNGDGVIDYFEFCKMFKRTAYTFCAKRAADLYEIHTSPKHNDEDILVRTKFKYLTHHPESPDSGWLEQLRTIFKMTDMDSTGKAKLSDLGNNLKFISAVDSKSLANELFQGGVTQDSRRIGFNEFYQMVYDHQKEKMDTSNNNRLMLNPF